MRRILSVLISTIVIAGCSSTGMTLSDCTSTDWQARGLADGSAGEDVLKFNEYVESCKESSITLDKEAYYSGFQDGLVIYCTQENGLERGKKGGQFYKACKEYPDYIVGYAKGAEIHIEERERREVEKLTRPTSRADTGGVAGGSSPTQ